MPQPRVPTEILEARGAYVAHPERRAARENEPKPSAPLGDPPKSLDAAHKRLWREIVSEIPDYVVGNCDRKVVEVASRLLYKIRKDTAMVSEQALFLKCLIELGMTPCARSKVKAVKPTSPEQSKWAFLPGAPKADA